MITGLRTTLQYCFPGLLCKNYTSGYLPALYLCILQYPTKWEHQEMTKQNINSEFFCTKTASTVEVASLLELRRISGSSNLRSLMYNYQIVNDVFYLRIFATCENCEHFRLTDENFEVLQLKKA